MPQRYTHSKEQRAKIFCGRRGTGRCERLLQAWKRSVLSSQIYGLSSSKFIPAVLMFYLF
jgi:hypothetical protein